MSAHMEHPRYQNNIKKEEEKVNITDIQANPVTMTSAGTGGYYQNAHFNPSNPSSQYSSDSMTKMMTLNNNDDNTAVSATNTKTNTNNATLPSTSLSPLPPGLFRVSSISSFDSENFFNMNNTDEVYHQKGKKYFLVFLACLQNLLCGGIIFGWAAITSGLLSASIEEGGAELSQRYIHQLFVVATSVNFSGPLLLGFLLDRFGPRTCSIISILLVALGCIVFGASNLTTFPFHLPGIVMIAFGGPGVQSAIIHVSNLFPSSKATATSIITGSFNLSFLIFVLFDNIWENYQLTYNEIFIGYGILLLAFPLTASIIFWPDRPYNYQKALATEEKLALDSKKVINENLTITSNKLYRADIIDRNGKYLSKTVSSIDIGIRELF